MTSASSSTDAGGPLSGVRILDLTQFLAGPYGTQMLGDLGAEVIKVEPPTKDASRFVAPHFVRDDSLYYLGTNRNKRDIVIDLKSEDGLRVFHDLLPRCDVVIDNYRPGVLARLGIDVEEILEERPDLIWCSVSGFGQYGPYTDRPAYDMIVQAMSGGMSMTGEPGRPPVRTGVPLGDLAAGLHAVIGVISALYERQVTGEGNFIDVALLDCQISMLSYQGMYYLHSGEVPGRQGSGHVAIPTYRVFLGSDGREVAITANTDRMWVALCEVLGLEGLAHDERFATKQARLAHKEEVWEVLEAAFATAPAAEWAHKLVEAGVPAALVNTVEDALTDPHVLEREMVLEMTAEDGTSVRGLGDPIKFRRNARSKHLFPPAHGQDTDDILQEVLGYPEEEVRQLRRSGAIRGAETESQRMGSST
jgi:CoA:oxalate CoA-transferase